MRLWLTSALVVSVVMLACSRGRCEEVQILELQNLPSNADPDDVKHLEEKQKKRNELLVQRKEMEQELAKTVQQLEEDRKKLAETQEVTATVDDHEVKCTEPRSQEDVLNTLDPKPNRRVRDEYEVSPEDFRLEQHERWTLNPSDFRMDRPEYITCDLTAGHAKKWFAIPFSVTDSNSKPRRIAPYFVAITNKGVSNYAVTGYMPERVVANSLRRPLSGAKDPADQELLNERVTPLESNIDMATYALDPESGAEKLSPMNTFQPGQTRWGVALWPKFSDEFTELKVLVFGLTNSHRYDENMARVLVLTFTRPDDEYNVERTELKLKDKRFDYIWMWDQGLTVPCPDDPKTPQINVQQLQTPSGGSKLAWAIPFKLINASRSPQDFALNTISYVCNVNVELAGAKIPVEVRVVDDGLSTIYKAQVLKAMGKGESKDRFQFANVEAGSKTRTERRKLTLEPGRTVDDILGIFDAADVDWKDVQFQIETALSTQMDKKAAAAATWERLAKSLKDADKDILQKNPGILFDPRRRLSDEELAQVKEQVTKAIPVALEEAKAKKTVVAYFDCISGLSSGSRRISRSYAKPGVVDEGWLNEWDNWYNEWEKAQEEVK